MEPIRVDAFGILLSTDEDNKGYGEMDELDEDDAGGRFAMREAVPHVYEAIGFEGTLGREGYEWEITSVVDRGVYENR